MTTTAQYQGVVELHDPETALRERVWAVLVAPSAAATPVWRGSLVPLHGTAFGALLPAHMGRTVRVRLLDAAETPAAWLCLEQWQAPAGRRGGPAGTACVLGTVRGLPATAAQPADAAGGDAAAPGTASSAH